MTAEIERVKRDLDILQRREFIRAVDRALDALCDAKAMDVADRADIDKAVAALSRMRGRRTKATK